MFGSEVEMLTGLKPVCLSWSLARDDNQARENEWEENCFSNRITEKTLLIALSQILLMTVPVTALGTATASLERVTAF